MSKYTPGKWKINLTDTNGHGGFSVETDKTTVCTVYAALVKAPRKKGDMAALPENAEAIANACLIASCPDMLKALKEVKLVLEDRDLQNYDNWHILEGLVNRTIAKAEGVTK